MKCTDCDGNLSIEESIDLPINEVPGNQLNHDLRPAFPCEKCLLLHTLIGDEVHKTPYAVMSGGEKCFLIEGKIVKLSKIRILTFSQKHKDAFPNDPENFYTGREFTDDYSAAGEGNPWDDAIIIFQGEPDPEKFDIPPLS